MNRYRELKALAAQGKITDLVMQPRFAIRCGGTPVLIRSEGFPNGRTASYTADFKYRVPDTGETIVEDCKGFDKASSKLRRALIEAEYGVRVVIVR